MRVVLAAVVAAAVAAPAAVADSTPIGPLPKGPVQSVSTPRGTLVSVALPHLAKLSWRIARPVDAKIVREVGEADVGTNVVVVLRAVGRGRASVAFAATRGDSGSKAFKSFTYKITVT